MTLNKTSAVNFRTVGYVKSNLHRVYCAVHIWCISFDINFYFNKKSTIINMNNNIYIFFLQLQVKSFI